MVAARKMTRPTAEPLQLSLPSRHPHVDYQYAVRPDDRRSRHCFGDVGGRHSSGKLIQGRAREVVLFRDGLQAIETIDLWGLVDGI